jgi:hypothetical protein
MRKEEKKNDLKKASFLGRNNWIQMMYVKQWKQYLLISTSFSQK